MSFTLEQDITDIQNALEAKKTDKNAIIKIIANRTNAYRQQLKEKYKNTYAEDLVEKLKKKFSGNFENAVVALFDTPIDYDCKELKAAMKGLGTNEDTLIEILGSRIPPVIKQIKKRYQEIFNNDLEEEVISECSGTLQKILVSLLQGRRSTNTHPDMDKCAEIAKELYNAGEAKLGTDEEIFVKYFGNLSPYELVTVAQEYHKVSGHTLMTAIEKEFSGNSKKALKTILYATISPSEYFATRVLDAIKGWGTNDRLLIRILITRDEIDMPKIKQYYRQLYKKDMIKDVKDDISGDYQTLMIELCDH